MKKSITLFCNFLLAIFAISAHSKDQSIWIHDVSHGSSILSISKFNVTSYDITEMRLKAASLCKGKLIGSPKQLVASDLKNASNEDSYFYFECEPNYSKDSLLNQNKPSLINNVRTLEAINSPSLSEKSYSSSRSQESRVGEQPEFSHYMKICNDLGLEKGSSNFKDCVLKLYEIDMKSHSLNASQNTRGANNSDDNIDMQIQRLEKLEEQRRSNTLISEGLKLLQQNNQPYIYPTPNFPIQTNCRRGSFGQINCTSR
jgi:hypothetical protein